MKITKCFYCGKEAEFVQVMANIENGKLILALECQECGELTFTQDSARDLESSCDSSGRE